MKLCVDAGGTITGEHGVGVDKRGYMVPKDMRDVAPADFKEKFGE